MKKLFLLSGLLVLLCSTFSCKKESPTSPKVPTITNVTVSSSNSTIFVGKTEQMTVTITMSDGTTKSSGGTWGSDNSSVASVNQSGLVTGMGPGDATIYFDSTGGGRGTKKLTVKAITPTQVTVSSPRSTIIVGQTEQMTATVTLSDGTTRPGVGTWGSDNMSVATVNQSGLVTGMGQGDATIYFDETGDGRGTKKLTVRAIWQKSGTGATVFDMPTYVKRVKITGKYTGTGENFVVWIGDDLVVNEILGTHWGQTYYEGTFLTSGGVVQVKYSNGLSWTFTEVLATTVIADSIRRTPIFTGKSIFGNRQYEIYKRESETRRR